MAGEKVGERARLSRQAVVDGALALVDGEGLDALTIRRLAHDLGVTPMALYWHFKGKEQLLAGLVDRVWSLIDGEVDDSAPWQDQLRTLMTSFVGVLRTHPGAVVLLMHVEVEKAPECLRIMEIALEIFHRAGFSPEQGAALCRHGLSTALALVTSEPGAAARRRGDLEEMVRHNRILFETLPPNRYPRLVEAAKPLTDCMDDTESHYTLGLNLYIAGISTLAP